MLEIFSPECTSGQPDTPFSLVQVVVSWSMSPLQRSTLLISPFTVQELWLPVSKFNIDKVIAKGKLVVDGSKMAVDLQPPARSEILSSKLQIPSISPADMKVYTDLKADKVNVLSMEVDFDVPFVHISIRTFALRLKPALIRSWPLPSAP